MGRLRFLARLYRPQDFGVAVFNVKPAGEQQQSHHHSKRNVDGKSVDAVAHSRGGDGGEFGATTGRPRRMGWFDAVASRYGVRMQGATEVALTVLDVLGYLDEIPVCVGYEIDGEVTKDFPVTSQLKKAKPVYETLPGWKEDIRGITEYDKLPENCRKYIEFIEKELGVPITMVSNGPGRHEIIYR